MFCVQLLSIYLNFLYITHIHAHYIYHMSLFVPVANMCENNAVAMTICVCLLYRYDSPQSTLLRLIVITFSSYIFKFVFVTRYMYRGRWEYWLMCAMCRRIIDANVFVFIASCTHFPPKKALHPVLAEKQEPQTDTWRTLFAQSLQYEISYVK